MTVEGKHQPIIDKKVKKYDSCKSIMIEELQQQKN